MPDTNSVSPANSHTPPSRGSHRRGLIAACFLFVGCVFGLAQAARAQQPAPLIVDADQVTYDQVTQQVEATGNVRLRYRGIVLSADRAAFDLRQEVLTAQGHVVLVDVRGQEFRGDALTYDVRLEQGELLNARTVIDRIHVLSERAQTRQRLVIGHNTTFTTCDPSRPAYRITAARVEITPGERLVARRASLWLGSLRVFTLPVLIVSLRSAEETAGSFPSVGYNSTDGLYVSHTYRYDIGSLPGSLVAKYGTKSGFIVNNTLRYSRGPYTAAFKLGRSQTVNLDIFDQAELRVELAERRARGLPLFYSGYVSGGWFRETASNVATTRVQYFLRARTPDFNLGPNTSWFAEASWEDSFYGTGARQGILRIDASVIHQLTERSALRLAYKLVEVTGGTPFTFDAVTDRPHRIDLRYTLAGRRRAATTSFSLGTSYSLRDRSVSVSGSYGERVPDRYHWSLGTVYNFTSREVSFYTDSGLSIGRGTYFTVQVGYNVTTQKMEDLIFILSSRICDCIELALKYRPYYQSRHVEEIWFEVGVTGFPQVQLQFPSPRP